MAALKVGVFGVVLMGLCSLLLGIISNFFTEGPMIYVAAMAGVLFPMVMVAAGGLAWWVSETPAGGSGHVAYSLMAGLITVFGGGALCAVTLVLPMNDFFSGGKPIIDSLSSGWDAYLGIFVLIAAYIVLAAIGGILYRLIFPAQGGSIY